MFQNPRKVLLGGLLFFGVFILTVIFLPFALPTYQNWVMEVGNWVSEQFTPPVFISEGEGKQWIFNIGTRGGDNAQLASIEIESVLFFLDLFLLPALLLITPTSWTKRALLLIAGLGVLFLVHVGMMTGFTRAEFCLYASSRYTPFQQSICDWFINIVGVGIPIFAIVIWGILTFRFWIRALAGSGAESG